MGKITFFATKKTCISVQYLGSELLITSTTFFLSIFFLMSCLMLENQTVTCLFERPVSLTRHNFLSWQVNNIVKLGYIRHFGENP